MEGKTCVITGATSGIGRATAVWLAGLGARVVIVGRTAERCESARVEVAAQGEPDQVDVAVADLSSQEEVRRLAGELRDRYERIDVLINNAAVVTPERKVTVDGLEMQFAVNYLSNFLLTRLLLDRLEQSAPSRVIMVSSDSHRKGWIDFDDLQCKRGYMPLRAYTQSKLAQLLFTYELARRMEGRGVVVNALHTGGVATNLLFTAVPAARALRRELRTPEQGAETSVYLASSAQIRKMTGRYFYNKRPIEPSPAAVDPDAARRLWQVSEALTGL